MAITSTDLIERFIESSNIQYDNDIVILDLTSLYLLSPAKIIIPNTENSSVQESVFIYELLEYITTTYVDINNVTNIINMISDILDKVNSNTNDNITIHSLHDSQTFVTLVEKIKKFITHYLSLVNRYAGGYINIYNLNNLPELDLITKLYTPSNIDIYISDTNIKMQMVLTLKTRRSL